MTEQSTWGGGTDPIGHWLDEIGQTMGAGSSETVRSAEPPPRSPYYVVRPDGEIRFRDIATEQVLSSNEVPPSILEDEESRTGMDFLSTNGQQLNVRQLIVDGSLLLDADALKTSGIDLRTEIEQQGGDKCVVFIPYWGPDMHREEMAFILSNLSRINRRHLQRSDVQQSVEQDTAIMEGMMGAGIRSIVEQIVGSGAVIQITGYSDSPASDRPAERALSEQRLKAYLEEDEDPRRKASFDSYVNWMRIARMGYILADRWYRAMKQRNIIYLGGENDRIDDKLQQFGVQVTGNKERS